jgi:NADH:ubiquinone oxidoreductase subunit H
MSLLAQSLELHPLILLMPDILITLITIAIAVGAVLTTVAYLILLERKLSAWMQDRRGPNRVGPSAYSSRSPTA